MRVSRIVPAALVFLAATPLAVWAQEEGASGGGGIFNINAGLSLWTIVVFLGLLFILGKFAWRPILDAVEAREQGIQGALDEAVRQHEEAEKLLAEQRKELADARRQASELIAQGKAAGERVRKEIEERAHVEGEAIIQRARQEIERERDSALDTLRRESVELAMAATAHLLHEKLDESRDKALIERYLDHLPDSGSAQA